MAQILFKHWRALAVAGAAWTSSQLLVPHDQSSQPNRFLSWFKVTAAEYVRRRRTALPCRMDLSVGKTQCGCRLLSPSAKREKKEPGLRRWWGWRRRRGPGWSRDCRWQCEQCPRKAFSRFRLRGIQRRNLHGRWMFISLDLQLIDACIFRHRSISWNPWWPNTLDVRIDDHDCTGQFWPIFVLISTYRSSRALGRNGWIHSLQYTAETSRVKTVFSQPRRYRSVDLFTLAALLNGIIFQKVSSLSRNIYFCGWF